MTPWTEQQVEAAAKMLREVGVFLAPGSWDDISDDLREHYRKKARAVLAAVDNCEPVQMGLGL